MSGVVLSEIVVRLAVAFVELLLSELSAEHRDAARVKIRTRLEFRKDAQSRLDARRGK